jgi:UDP-N-acetylmuramoyl-L-alanyl-D-glutamate--2,6-diaminopimelate ligase
MTAHTPRGDMKIYSPLVGRFNAYNLLCALAVSESLGLSHEAFVSAASQFTGAPGRLEKFALGRRWAYVDYAHTPDALHQALLELRSLSRGPLHVLFGCGGNRDRTKRPLMARAAEENADKVYVTSDNPRDEEPAMIAAEILAGFKDPGRAELILDRREAIRTALTDLPPEGILLIAGKGHEDYQEIGGVKHPFDDRAEVRRYLAERS